MSLEAYIWAANLRLDDCKSGTAFRVLLKYADRADEVGRATWYYARDLASDLGCSRATIQRATAYLLDQGLISAGDQRYVSHIPASYRPVVYDLETPAKQMQDGMRTGVAFLDTSDKQVSQPRPRGVSSVATQGTVKNLPTKTHIGQDSW